MKTKRNSYNFDEKLENKVKENTKKVELKITLKKVDNI